MPHDKKVLMELKTEDDIVEMLTRYQRGMRGYGLGTMLDTVTNSSLPLEIKRKYFMQHARGSISVSSFKAKQEKG